MDKRHAKKISLKNKRMPPMFKIGPDSTQKMICVGMKGG